MPELKKEDNSSWGKWAVNRLVEAGAKGIEYGPTVLFGTYAFARLLTEFDNSPTQQKLNDAIGLQNNFLGESFMQGAEAGLCAAGLLEVTQLRRSSKVASNLFRNNAKYTTDYDPLPQTTQPSPNGSGT